MTKPLTHLINPTHNLQAILASNRLDPSCLPTILGSSKADCWVCPNELELVKGLRDRAVDVLLLDVELLHKQTQSLCWRVQNLYPDLKIVLVGTQASELANHNWVYEFPEVSVICLSPHSELSHLPSEFPMSPDPNSETSFSPASGGSYTDFVVGAAIFDLNGLPREYLIAEEINNMSWVQTIFQALGLRSLLMSSLQLEGFHHATIHSKGYSAVIVKQKSQYTALLVRVKERNLMTEAFVNWAQNFDPELLKVNPLFRLA
ncbi:MULTISPECIES: hypothetical protein [Desertifilum]|uniref:Uncharacterized protein n=1 Tax=Desertifilum tharense IPPAS B-1220 TaxID=1781255 RepID=A0ACD5H0R7_9CYAN|nr:MULTISPECIES: hypothetical protein [Desertifilum]MDA0212630.1 hypothetical protein [Cyanobacteria bacterium FC1]